MPTRKLLLVFIPAILIVAIAFGIHIFRYEPLYPKVNAAENTKKDTFVIPLFPDDPILGDKRAPKTVVVFEDLACPGCKTQSNLLHELVKAHPGQIKVIWKLLSVTQFPYPTKTAHHYAYCANQQGQFDAFVDFAFVNSANLSDAILSAIVDELKMDKKEFDACVSSEAAGAYSDTIEEIARALNIQSVPAIFVNNQQIQPPSVREGWETLLQLK